METLRNEEYLYDVTLASDDDEQIEAHRVILSMCSPLFRNIFKNNKHPHPLLYMRGIKMSNLQLLISFIYQGEVNVPQERLEIFLAMAQELKIKGLTNSLGENHSYYNPIPFTPPAVEEDASFTQESENKFSDLTFTSFDDSLNEIALVNEDPKEEKQEIEHSNDVSDLDNSANQEEDLIGRHDGIWFCQKCGKTAKYKHHIKSHMEIHVEGVAYPCNHCGKTYKSKNSLQSHISVNHRQIVEH